MHVCFVWHVLPYLFTRWSSYVLLHSQLPENLGALNSHHFIILDLTTFWIRNWSKTQHAKMTLLLVWTRTIWEYPTAIWTGLESLKQSHSDDTPRQGGLEGWPQLRLKQSSCVWSLQHFSLRATDLEAQGSPRWFQDSQADAASLMT